MQVSPSSQLLAALAAFTEARRGDVSPDETGQQARPADPKGDATAPLETSPVEPAAAEQTPGETRDTRFSREAPGDRQQRFQRPGQLVDISV